MAWDGLNEYLSILEAAVAQDGSLAYGEVMGEYAWLNQGGGGGHTEPYLSAPYVDRDFDPPKLILPAEIANAAELDWQRFSFGQYIGSNPNGCGHNEPFWGTISQNICILKWAIKPLTISVWWFVAAAAAAVGAGVAIKLSRDRRKVVRFRRVPKKRGRQQHFQPAYA